MESKMAEDPIFIMGASRSGTAMLRAIVANHPAVFMPGETHYFDDLRPRMAGCETTALSDSDRRICEDYFLALCHRPYGHQGDPELGSLDREELRSEADALGTGADAYFEAFCRIQSEAAGCTMWGDKTPRHIFRIPDILERYPGARVICMVRDPRGVVASYRDWSNQGGFDLEADPDHAVALEDEEMRARASYHPVIASLLWKGSVQAALSARDRFGSHSVHVQQYEELIRDPEGAVREIASFLGLEFSREMLDIPVLNSSFSRFDQQGGISDAPVERWRAKLTPAEIAVVQQCTAASMRAAGYTIEPVSPGLAVLRHWLNLPLHLVFAFRANLDRMGGNPVDYLWKRLVLAVGGGR